MTEGILVSIRGRVLETSRLYTMREHLFYTCRKCGVEGNLYLTGERQGICGIVNCGGKLLFEAKGESIIWQRIRYSVLCNIELRIPLEKK